MTMGWLRIVAGRAMGWRLVVPGGCSQPVVCKRRAASTASGPSNCTVKRKFGDSVRSRTDVAKTTEALCKFVCYNLCIVIVSQIELGMEAEFWPDDNQPRDVLRLVAR